MIHVRLFLKVCFPVAALCAPPVLPAAMPVGPPVTVSASRTAQTVDGALASVTVITRADIERTQAPDVFELLRGLAGVDVTRSGGLGQNMSMFLRGTNSNHVLVLVDGVRVASSNTGAYTFEHLSPEQIERIEIVRGPRAAYWGSDAIGGVIHIFTRNPQGWVGRAALGRWDRREGSLGYGMHSEQSGFSAHASGVAFAGFSAQNERGFSYDSDRDGYLQRNFSGQGYREVGNHRLELHALARNADVEFDQGVSHARDESVALAASGPLSDSWSHSLTVGHAHEYFNTPAFFNAFSTGANTVDWVHEWSVAASSRWLFGLNAKNEEGSSTDTGAGQAQYRQRRRNTGLFSAWHGTHGDWDWETAWRIDRNSAFGNTDNFQAAAGWRVHERWRAFASWGQGFRAPNLNELYSPGFGGLFAGNPALQPERSRSGELGVDWFGTDWNGRARAFDTRIGGLIAFEGDQAFRAINIDRARIRGLELGGSGNVGGYRWDADLTWQDARDADSGRRLLRRPQRKIHIDVQRAWPRWALGAGMVAASRRRDFASDLGGYAVLHLRAEYRWSPSWRVAARLDNLTDRDYALADGFNVPRRSLLLSVTYAQNAQ